VVDAHATLTYLSLRHRCFTDRADGKPEGLSAMRLLTAHKILISAAVVLALLLAARAAFNYSSTQAKSDAASIAAGLVLAGVLGTYLRTIWRR
jgi:hypothetical protein